MINEIKGGGSQGKLDSAREQVGCDQGQDLHLGPLFTSMGPWKVKRHEGSWVWNDGKESWLLAKILVHSNSHVTLGMSFNPSLSIVRVM